MASDQTFTQVLLKTGLTNLERLALRALISVYNPFTRDSLAPLSLHTS
jgi:hypothetical protein